MSVDQAEVDRLYDSVLAPKIVELEGLRLQLKQTITKAVILVVAPFLLFWFGDFLGILLPPGFGFLASAVGILLVFAAVIFVGVRYLIPGFTAYINYRQRFKHEIVSEIFKIVCPTAAYDPNHGVSQELFDEPGLFNTRGSFKSDDRVRGKIGRTPFEAAEVQRQYSTGGKNSTTYIVFKGLFFHIDFNKTVRGTTIVEPESAPSYRVGNRDGLSPVTLESPDFEGEFAVHSDNEVEARYILTPVMMEQLLALRQRTGHPVYLAFKRNRVYLGIHYDRSLFEPGIASTTSREAIEEMASLFALAETIVHELDLNTRIWTKDVDESLLHRPDEGPKDGLDAVAAQARAGTLTPEQLWAAATAGSRSDQAEDDGKVVSRPAGSSIAVDRSPGSVTIAYGGTATLLVLIVLWIVSVLVGISAARALIASFSSTTGLGPLRELGEALPAIPVVDAYTVSVPVAWFLGAAIPGSLIGLGWMFRVRRVEIAADGVHILRGLRPWPRRYPRPPYDKVIVMERAVYVGKATGLNLVNPSASPMLKADEARWVAREMRQAMKETAMRTSMLVLWFTLLAGLAGTQPGTAARNDLPQPYRTTRDWGELPPGVKWAAVTAIEPAPDGTIYVVHRCFENSCAGRPEAPILKYNSQGTLLASFGQGLFVFPHGGTVDADGNLWMTDAGSAPGKGHQVLKFGPDGKVLMTLGKAGVSGSGPDLFDQPTDIVVAPNGDLFVTDSHRNGKNNRVVHFTKEGRFVEEWGRKGSSPGELSEPHTIAMDSRGRLFVGDRENNRIQIFDQAGRFLEEWRQFGRPSGIAITRDDRIYVADSESWGTDTGARELPGVKKGIRIGSARTGVVDAFIEDMESTAADHAGAEGVGVDAQGNVYGGVVRRRMLERHILR